MGRYGGRMTVTVSSGVPAALSSLSGPQVVILILAGLVAIGLIRAVFRVVKVAAKVALVVLVVLLVGGVGAGVLSGGFG